MHVYFDRFNRILRDADVEGSGGTGGEAENTDANAPAKEGDTGAPSAEDLQKLIAKAVDEAVAGLKKKNAELIGKEKTLKAELEAAKQKPSLSDEEYTEFKTLKERMEQDKLLKALAEGKADEVIETVTKKTRLDYEAKLAAEAEAKKALAAEAQTAKSQLEQLVVNMEITKAAAGAVKSQYTDLVTKLVAERVKLVDGAVRVVDAHGEVETTASGKPLTVGDYIETLRANYGDLFVASAGGGAGGSGRKPAGGGSGKIPLEAAETMPFDEYMRLRAEGKI